MIAFLHESHQFNHEKCKFVFPLRDERNRRYTRIHRCLGLDGHVSCFLVRTAFTGGTIGPDMRPYLLFLNHVSLLGRTVISQYGRCPKCGHRMIPYLVASGTDMRERNSHDETLFVDVVIPTNHIVFLLSFS